MTVYMYFLWAKINMVFYGHTMFSLKLLILIVIRQCIMSCLKGLTIGGRWMGGVSSATTPGTILMGPSRTILTCPNAVLLTYRVNKHGL